MNPTLLVPIGGKPIYQILEHLENISDVNKFKLKAVYDKQLKEGIFVNGKIYYKVSEFTQEVSKFNHDSVIVVRSSDYDETIFLYQQFIYLEIAPKIYPRKEFYKKILLKSIRKNLDYKEQHINIGIFSTKKSGKSTLINALLKDEYSPSSYEIPTPCIIEYKPVKYSRYIKLYIFDKVERLSNQRELIDKLNNIFKSMAISGKELPKITIEYPKLDSFNFNLYDTPGVDLAGSKHYELVEEILEKIDCAIFIVDYTKYAQKSELELLEKIKSYFDKVGKNVPIVCVVNKIDAMFTDAGSEKIKVRVADFIYNKLKYLNLRDFIVIPISAITELYLSIIRKHFPEIEKSKCVIDFLKSIKDNAIKKDKRFRTYINFIENISNNLRDAFHMKEVKYQDLIYISGFDVFRNYLLNCTESIKAIYKDWSYVSDKFNKETKHKNIAKQKLILYIRNEVNAFYNMEKEKLSKPLKQALENSRIKAIKYLRKLCDRDLQKLYEILQYHIGKLEKNKIKKKEFISFWKSVRPESIECHTTSELLHKTIKYYTKNLFKLISDELKPKLKVLNSKITNEQEKIKNEISNFLKIQLHYDIFTIKVETTELKRMIDSYTKHLLYYDLSIEVEDSIFNENIKGGFIRGMLFYLSFGIMKRYIVLNGIEKIVSIYESKLRKFEKLLNTELKNFALGIDINNVCKF